MKKFISMLAGVVMASTMFAASAYAENYWSMTVSPTEVEIGDTVTVVLATAEKTLGGDLAKVYYDTDAFELIDVIDDAGESYTSEDSEFLFAKKNYFTVNHSLAAKNVSFSWSSGDTNKTMKENEEFATLTFKAIAATDGAEFKLFENCAADGADVFNGYVDSETEVVVVKGGAPAVTWNEADASWAAPAGKKAIWWPFDYEAGTFPGHVFVEVTDGARTETIGIGANADYDVNGAVSFAVAVILGADVDATNFDCVVK